MVCEKEGLYDFILPGGSIESGESDMECLKREIKEEMATEVDAEQVALIGEYVDVAAGDPTKDVMIRLYQGSLLGEPKPSMEILSFYWMSKNDPIFSRLSPILKNKVVPDLLARRILK